MNLKLLNRINRNDVVHTVEVAKIIFFAKFEELKSKQPIYGAESKIIIIKSK